MNIKKKERRIRYYVNKALKDKKKKGLEIPEWIQDLLDKKKYKNENIINNNRNDMHFKRN